MVPYEYERFFDNLVELVKDGEVAEERIDDAVLRILKVKIALNLFNTPVTHYENYPKFGNKEFEQVAFNMAAEAITLLKNKDDILPLQKTARVLVTGSNVNSMRTLNGAWTYPVGRKNRRICIKLRKLNSSQEKHGLFPLF